MEKSLGGKCNIGNNECKVEVSGREEGGGRGKLVLRESGARWKILRGSRGRLVDPADSV